jgi:hypothetical protein
MISGCHYSSQFLLFHGMDARKPTSFITHWPTFRVKGTGANISTVSTKVNNHCDSSSIRYGNNLDYQEE